MREGKKYALVFTQPCFFHFVLHVLFLVQSYFWYRLCFSYTFKNFLVSFFCLECVVFFNQELLMSYSLNIFIISWAIFKICAIFRNYHYFLSLTWGWNIVKILLFQKVGKKKRLTRDEKSVSLVYLGISGVSFCLIKSLTGRWSN